jgi:hypothetical protein
MEDLTFSPSYDLVSPPPPPPTKLSFFLSLPVCHRSSLLVGEGERGGEEGAKS